MTSYRPDAGQILVPTPSEKVAREIHLGGSARFRAPVWGMLAPEVAVELVAPLVCRGSTQFSPTCRPRPLDSDTTEALSPLDLGKVGAKW